MRFEIHCDVKRPTLLAVESTYPKALERAREIEKDWKAEAAQRKLPNYYFWPLRIEGVGDACHA